MKKIVTIGIGCLLSLSLSGCSLGSVIDRFTASDDAAIQDINPEITRVYMDEIRGELLEKGIELKDTREGVKWKRI